MLKSDYALLVRAFYVLMAYMTARLTLCLLTLLVGKHESWAYQAGYLDLAHAVLRVTPIKPADTWWGKSKLNNRYIRSLFVLLIAAFSIAMAYYVPSLLVNKFTDFNHIVPGPSLSWRDFSLSLYAANRANHGNLTADLGTRLREAGFVNSTPPVNDGLWQNFDYIEPSGDSGDLEMAFAISNLTIGFVCKFDTSNGTDRKECPQQKYTLFGAPKGFQIEKLIAMPPAIAVSRSGWAVPEVVKQSNFPFELRPADDDTMTSVQQARFNSSIVVVNMYERKREVGRLIVSNGRSHATAYNSSILRSGYAEELGLPHDAVPTLAELKTYISNNTDAETIIMVSRSYNVTNTEISELYCIYAFERNPSLRWPFSTKSCSITKMAVAVIKGTNTSGFADFANSNSYGIGWASYQQGLEENYARAYLTEFLVSGVNASLPALVTMSVSANQTLNYLGSYDFISKDNILAFTRGSTEIRVSSTLYYVGVVYSGVVICIGLLLRYMHSKHVCTPLLDAICESARPDESNAISRRVAFVATGRNHIALTVDGDVLVRSSRKDTSDSLYDLESLPLRDRSP